MSDYTPPTPGQAAPAAHAGPSPDGAPGAAPAKTASFSRDGYAREINRGYSEALGRGFELAITLAVMVGVGLLLDRLFGTAPLFTIVLSLVGFAGTGVKLKLGYDLEMRKHEDGAIWNRKPEGAG